VKLAHFLFGILYVVALVFLALPSFSYAKNTGQITVSAVVLEHLTYTENDGQITAITNLKNQPIVLTEGKQRIITMSF